jgi:predicted AlkP superfamily phosphohydrolase/phosphomutase
MGEALVRATDVRARAARWLLEERLPDWDLALVVVSEPHSAIEGLWHGVDVTHPLHHSPSGIPAGNGLRTVYRAVDRLVGDLAEAFDDATTLVFSMGGMGPNRSDAASMFLLPELLYRHAFGRPLMQQPPSWSAAPNGIPRLLEEDNWSTRVNSLIPEPDSRPVHGAFHRAVSWLTPEPLKCVVRRAVRGTEPDRQESRQLALGWMPAIRYRHYWPTMRAFALPSFYDGRVRINLVGRESQGQVAVSEYVDTCDSIEGLVRACRDPLTGESVVDHVERPASGRDPRRLGTTEADLVFIWTGPLAFDHPSLGRIGPIPFRRTGGHTGPFGMAYLHGPGIIAGDRGVRSAFDVVPTLFELVGGRLPTGLSGTSLLAVSGTERR